MGLFPFGTQDNSKIMPSGTTATGYGGQPYGSVDAAAKSNLRPLGTVTDRNTGYVGTPQQIYDRYVADGRDPGPLFQQFGR